MNNRFPAICGLAIFAGVWVDWRIFFRRVSGTPFVAVFVHDARENDTWRRVSAKVRVRTNPHTSMSVDCANDKVRSSKVRGDSRE